VSGSSRDGRLRDLLPAVQSLAIKGAAESSDIPVTAQATEGATDLVESGRDPADEHAAIAPAAHVAHEAPDETVEVLDRVRTPQRSVEGAAHAEALEFAKARQAVGVGQAVVEAVTITTGTSPKSAFAATAHSSTRLSSGSDTTARRRRPGFTTV
jgi:hypothetical protein